MRELLIHDRNILYHARVIVIPMYRASDVYNLEHYLWAYTMFWNYIIPTRYFTGYSICLFLSQMAPISADMSQAYDPFDWQTSRSMMDISKSTSFEYDKFGFENSNSDEYDYILYENVYDYTVQNLDGQEVCLRKYA